MNKIITKDIELILKDLNKNGLLSNQDLTNKISRDHIRNLIFDMINSIHNINNKILINNFIESLLNTSIKIYNPIYNTKQINYLRNIIKNLKKIKQPEQRTPEWYEFRNNRLTASDLGTVINVNPYEQYDTVIKKKCGMEKPFYMNNNILKGIKFEDVIIQIYEKINNCKVFEYGCIAHPKIKHFGASPDGIVDYISENRNYIGRMVEIKCPSSRAITGFIPAYYLAQVQGQLEVCDLDYCDFVECKIEEYKNFDEYLEDFLTENNHYLNKNNLYKGVIIEGYDLEKNKNIFFYCDLGLNKEEIIKWEDETIGNIFENKKQEYTKTTYWKSIEYNELLIKRDKKYFNEICLPKINKFWDDVIYYRNNKHLLEKSDKPKKKLPKKKVIQPKSDFLSDSD